jgi:glycosyltransferase involved in cell wall biosynthesis
MALGLLRLLCVGSVRSGAGQALLVKVLGSMPADLRGQLEVCFAGPEVDRELSLQLRESTVHQENVHWLGVLSSQALRCQIERSDVLVCSADPVIPLAALDAMANGKPVVALSRMGGLGLIRDGESGYRVDPDSPGQLLSVLKTLLSERLRLAEMAARARQTIATDYPLTQWGQRVAQQVVRAERTSA